MTEEPLIPDSIPADLAAIVRQVPVFVRYLKLCRVAGLNPRFYFDKKLAAWRVYTKKCVTCESKKISEFSHSARKGKLEVGFQVQCRRCQLAEVGN